MIYGIGTDIVEVSRFRNMKSLDAFAKKYLTSEELNYFNDLEDSKKPLYLAKQFSIKEAISKAFGTGIRQEVLLSNMSIACLLYTSPSPRDGLLSRMPSSA